MKTAATIVQMLIRFTSLILIVLGVLFWMDRALDLLPVHIIVGLVFVLLLWVLAFLGLRARVGPGSAFQVALWGAVALVLGMTQNRLLTDNAHWVIQALHLLVGVGTVGLAERLAARIKRVPA